jgi:hypothetical protein
MSPRAAPALLLAALLCAGATAETPPAPDYARADAWAAWPNRASGADVVPPGLTGALPHARTADVFFIHPTTYLSGAVTNARYDEPGVTSGQIDRGVLRFQASAFNACCRIYAPHYRQAAIGAFMTREDTAAHGAFELAYGDVLRAFDYYLQHENHGRPFFIASHSQGSLHAMRVLQERVAGAPLRARLVAAYVIGYYMPQDIERSGIAVCRSAQQTGCFVVWNTIKADASGHQRESSRLIWLDGRYQHVGARELLCVNPLTWTVGADAPATLNLGALPGVRGEALRAPVPQLTGARCDGAALRVSIPLDKRRGFTDVLSLFGSYHVFDYNLFYTNIRLNAQQRLSAWRAANPG